MTRIIHDDLGRLILKRGPGLGILLGIPLLILGATAASSPLWCEYAFLEAKAKDAPALFLGLGVALFAGGIACTFYTRRIVIDKRDGTVFRFKSALGIGSRRTVNLQDYKGVAVRSGKAAMRGGSSKPGSSRPPSTLYSVYRVYLLRPERVPFIVEESRDLASVRNIAEAVSAFTGLDLEDETESSSPSTGSAPG